MEEKDWLCPECIGELYKEGKTGAGCKTCEGCGAVWFILKLRKAKERPDPATSSKGV